MALLSGEELVFDSVQCTMGIISMCEGQATRELEVHPWILILWMYERCYYINHAITWVTILHMEETTTTEHCPGNFVRVNLFACLF